jgi:predicted HicB family RNase H-like nuclease
MSKRNVKRSLQELLTLAQKLSETPGLTWVEANNAIYRPGGPFNRLFTTSEDRVAFQNSAERKQIDDLIDSLPDPPIRPESKEYSGKFNVRIPKSLHAALAIEAEAEGVSLNQLVLAKLALHLQSRS